MTVQKNKRAELTLTGITRMRLGYGVGCSTIKLLSARVMSGSLFFFAGGGWA
jgi:hypothetical protein